MAAAAAAAKPAGRHTRLLLALVLTLLLLLAAPAAAGLFSRKKPEPDVEKAKAALQESLDAAAAADKKKDAPAPRKQKPAAGVTARKLVKETEVVEGQNLTFAYDVHNAGPLTARNVVVDDAAALAGLRVLEGEGVMTFPELQPHTRDRRVVVVAADSERVIPSTKATVTWAVVDPESGEELTAEGVSTSNPVIEVLTWTNYRRAKKMYGKEYTLFWLGILPPVVVPLLVWLALAATNEKRYGKGSKKRR